MLVMWCRQISLRMYKDGEQVKNAEVDSLTLMRKTGRLHTQMLNYK